MKRQHATAAVAVLLVLTTTWCVNAADAPVAPELDSVVEGDPSLAAPASKIIFSKKLKPLWLKALAGPEADLKREVAKMIARAHRRGMAGLKDTAGPLLKELSARNQRSVVRLAIARTLVVLDARNAAAPLFALLDAEGLGFAQIVEPALARWNHKPIRKHWMDRLDEGKTRRGLLQLAIRGLGQVREPAASEPLWKLVQKRSTSPSLRLDAAWALGRIKNTGLVDRARTLAKDKTSGAIVDRLIAAGLMSHHSDKASQQLLLELAVDRQPAVAAVALERLLEIDSAIVIPIVAESLKSTDANVRMLAARALADQPVPSSVRQLGPVLNDRHPDVRRFACRTLFSYGSRAELKKVVRETADRVLGQQDWRGQEQAAFLVGALDHKPAAVKLVKLLDTPRREARVAVAWALRKLAVAATLPAMISRANRIVGKRTPEFDGTNNEQLVQLMQAFGQQKYSPAIELMWRFIPKSSPFTIRERVTAIWALGHFDVGDRKSELSRLLQGRLSDLSPLDPEADPVRAISAVTLGRLKIAAAVPKLRGFYKTEPPPSEVGIACRWAIVTITGEMLPVPKRRIIEAAGWSLSPLPPRPSK